MHLFLFISISFQWKFFIVLQTFEFLHLILRKGKYKIYNLSSCNYNIIFPRNFQNFIIFLLIEIDVDLNLHIVFRLFNIWEATFMARFEKW